MNKSNRHDRAPRLQGPRPNAWPRPRLLILGAWSFWVRRGCGKGTQADLVEQRLGACHLLTGDVFRAAAHRACEPSPAMTAALDYMRRGALVPDASVWEVVRERSGCLRCRDGFILEGFPAPSARPNP
jgi:adenylate kinase family enzyme